MHAPPPGHRAQKGQPTAGGPHCIPIPGVTASDRGIRRFTRCPPGLQTQGPRNVPGGNKGLRSPGIGSGASLLGRGPGSLGPRGSGPPSLGPAWHYGSTGCWAHPPPKGARPGQPPPPPDEERGTRRRIPRLSPGAPGAHRGGDHGGGKNEKGRARRCVIRRGRRGARRSVALRPRRGPVCRSPFARRPKTKNGL